MHKLVIRAYIIYNIINLNDTFFALGIQLVVMTTLLVHSKTLRARP